MWKPLPAILLLAALTVHAGPPRVTTITEGAAPGSAPIKDTPGKVRIIARAISSVALSPDGRKLALGMMDTGGGGIGKSSAPFVAVLIWDVAAAKVVSTVPVDGVPSDVFWLADGTLWATESMNSKIRRIDVEKGAVTETRELRADPTYHFFSWSAHVLPSPDGKLAVVAGFDKFPSLYELPEWKLVGPLGGATGGSPFDGAWSRDGKSWIAASRNPEVVFRWDVATGEAKRLGAGFAPVEGPDGRAWAFTEDHLAFGPVEPKQEEKRDWYRTDDSKFTLARFSPDGTYVALGREDGNVIVVDAASGAWFTAFFHVGEAGRRDAVTCLQWAADGSWIAAGRTDGSSDLMRPEIPESK